MAEESLSQTSRLEDPFLSHTRDLVIPSSLKFLMSNVKSVITVSLASDNYNIWSSQITKLFSANGYFEFLEGSIQCPPKLHTQPTGELAANPNYNTWQLLDQNLAAALLSTISTPILPYVLNLTSTAEIWTTLQKRLQSTNRSRVIQLKNELFHISMKTQSMTQYLSAIKSIADQLAAAGSPIHSEDIILYTLNGLPQSYQSFKTAIRTRADPISPDDLYSLLCSEEVNLQEELTKESSISHLALYSNRGRTSSPYQRGRGRTQYGGRRGSSSYVRTGHRFNSNAAVPTCQICEKVGHTATACWHRGNFDYTPTKHPMANNAYLADSLAAPSMSTTSEWLLDSGASSHLTNDIQQLHQPTPYNGSDQVYVGNGKSVPITHSGRGLLPTPHRKFQLHHLLHVPNLTHNLISIHKLTDDNNCAVTFDTSGFFIKDLKTNKILHQGTSRDS